MFKLGSWYFGEPLWLLGLIIIPFLSYFLLRKDANKKGIWKVTHFQSEKLASYSKRISLFRRILSIIPIIGVSALFFSLARPYSNKWEVQLGLNAQNGIDIILAMDISKSMTDKDFNPTRMDVAKKVAKDFVQGRKNDRIGLVVYAGQAFTMCPATTDYPMLIRKIDEANTDMRIARGTAIGVGLGTAVTRLRDEAISSKVIILLTDGSNNAGDISPIEAAHLAKMKGIRVYTIGMGQKPSKIINPYGVSKEVDENSIDEATLQQMASITNGKYFHAMNENALRNIYKEIDVLEKRKIDHQNNKKSSKATPLPFLWVALICLGSYWLLNTLLFHTND